MKKNSLITKLALSLLLLFTQSCVFLQAHKTKPAAVSLGYDNKTLLFNPPANYCFYDEKNSAKNAGKKSSKND